MILFKSETYQNQKQLNFEIQFKAANVNDVKKLNDTDWTPHLFEGPRSIANWKGTQCLVIDIDEGITIEQFLHKFRRYKVFICTSRNHNKEKNGIICDRFHALFPVKMITDPDEYNKIISKLLEIVGTADEVVKDRGRFFFGNKDCEVYQTTGDKYITYHPVFKNKDSPERGITIKILAGAGLGKTHLIKHLKKIIGDMGRYCSTTWLSARNFDGKTIQSTINKDDVHTCKRKQRIDWIVIDEAGMWPQKDIETLIKNNPYKNFIITGDPNQMIFNGDNGLDARADKTIILKNDINPRITDYRLKDAIEALLSTGNVLSILPIISMKQCNGHTKYPVIAYTNAKVDDWNHKFDMGQQGIQVKALNNTKIYSRNELFKVVDYNPWTVKLQRNSNNELLTINMAEYSTFTLAEATTAHTFQGQTVDKISIDLGSLVLTTKKGEKFISVDTMIRFLYTAMSRVRSLDDLNFINAGDFLNCTNLKGNFKLWRPNPNDIVMEVNELIKDIQKIDTIKSTLIELNCKKETINNSFDYNYIKDLVKDNMKQELAITQYVELCRYDHNGKDGGRGKLILNKALNRIHRHNWTKDMAYVFIDKICKIWNCSEKADKLKEYL